MVFEYGIMSNKWSLEADNKLVAYATMILHLRDSVNMIALYSPKDVVKDDKWFFSEDLNKRLEDIFGENPIDFIDRNIEVIKKAYETIKKVV